MIVIANVYLSQIPGATEHASVYRHLAAVGGKRDDVMIEDFSVSADGSEMTLKAGIAGSAGYLRKVKVRYDDEYKTVLVDFYSTFGINNPVGAEDTFVIPLKPDSENIFFNRGNDYYAALAKDADGRWYKCAR